MDSLGCVGVESRRCTLMICGNELIGLREGWEGRCLINRGFGGRAKPRRTRDALDLRKQFQF